MAGLNGCVLASTVLFLAFALVFLAGFGSPYWVMTTLEFRDVLGFDVNKLGPGSQSGWVEIHFGLWLVCGQTRRCEYWTSLGDISGPLRTTQVFMCLGFLALIATCVAYIWWLRNQYRPAARRLSISLCILCGFLTLIAVCVFGDEYAKVITLPGWGYWNTVICTIGFLMTGILTGCIMAIAPMIEKNIEDTKLELEPQKTKRVSDPWNPNDNLGYTGTPKAPSAPVTSSKRESKISYAESLNSSVAGSSIAGFGLLSQAHPQGRSSDRESIGPVDSKPYYYSGSQAQTKEAEATATPPIASKPPPDYYTKPEEASAPQVQPLHPANLPEESSSPSQYPIHTDAYTRQNPQYLYSTPTRPIYETSVYQSGQPMRKASESDV